MNGPLAMAVCEFPERLHPVSRLVLDYFLRDVISTAEFLRFFSLPNSDYISLTACLVTMLNGAAPVAG
ncbi:MAG: hypothetical protein GWN34_19790 [Gammaproteobacteria bacterium]|nr:hypothetical protein [Gammaproteobacteria bacterium]